MTTETDVRAIVDALKELYPDSLCSLQYEKDYELLFAVRLSAQCTDERVNMVTPALYERFPTLEAFAEADECTLLVSFHNVFPVLCYELFTHDLFYLMKERLLHSLKSRWQFVFGFAGVIFIVIDAL